MPENPELAARRASSYELEETRVANRQRSPRTRRVRSSGLRAKGEGILVGAQESVVACDLLGEGRDEAFAIDGDAKGGVDAVEELGYVQRGAGLFKYVKGHIDLRQTFIG